jgi:hypothetical protein
MSMWSTPGSEAGAESVPECGARLMRAAAQCSQETADADERFLGASTVV